VILVTLITFYSGLHKRGSFADNWIFFNEKDKATHIDSYGLAHGDFSFVADGNDSLTLDFVIIPNEFTDTNFKVFAQIGPMGNDNPLIIGQWRTHLIILQGKDFANKLKKQRLQADMSKFVGQELQVSVVLNKAKNELYLNERLVDAYSPAGNLFVIENSKLSIGNSHNGKLGWSGTVKKFSVSVAGADNTSVKVVRDYAFSDWSGLLIRDISNSNSALSIPKPGRFPEKAHLRVEGMDALFEWNLRDVLINLFGIIPMGMAMAWVATQSVKLRNKRLIPVILAIALCGSVSLLIELSQQYIPGRQSHLHDLILNICGGTLGVIWFNLYTGLLQYLSKKTKQIPEN